MQINIPAEQAVRPVLEEGTHGEGCDYPADVDLVKFQWPSEKFPGWDRDGTKGPYALFTVRVLTEDGTQHFLDRFVTPDRLKSTLLQLGVQPIDAGDGGGFNFNTDELEGMKLKGVEVTAPRVADSGTYNGNLKKFLAY